MGFSLFSRRARVVKVSRDRWRVLLLGGSVGGGGGGGGTSLTVKESDGSPSVADVSEIRFPNGSLSSPSATVVEVVFVQPGASVNRSTAQSIANASFVAISWDTEVFDRGGYFDTGQPTRFTVPAGQGGSFDVYFAGEYASSGVGQRQWLFRLNGSSFLQIETHGVVGGGARSFAYIQDLALSAGDYIECMAYQDSGGALNFSPTRASIRKVG